MMDAMTGSTWRVAGRYLVLGRIGSGGMADVLRAHDELLDRDVAVKVFRSVPSTPDTAMGVERQHAELRALARLNHPNLTVLYDGSIVGQDGPAYLVMELIAGGSLAEAIENGGLGVDHTTEVGAQVADALAYVHAAGMVHRDVKPANILLGADRIADTDFGRARLTDFGIVRLIGDEPLTQADMTLGSASYLAPEQTRGSGVGPPADVYALGLSLLEALTGHRSFQGPPLEAALARLTNDPDIPPDLPQPWPGLLQAMTARDPAMRPTAAQVAKALRNTDTTAAALTALPVPGLLGDGDTTAYLPRAAPVGSTTALPPVQPQPGRPPVGPPPPVRAPRPAYADVPKPADRQRRFPLWVALLLGVIVLLLVIGGVLLATSGSGGGGGSSTSPTPSTTAPSSTPTPTPSVSSTQQQDTSAPESESEAPPSDTSAPPSSDPPSSASSAPTTSKATSGSASSSTSTSSTPAANPPPGKPSKPAKPSRTKKPKQGVDNRVSVAP